MEDKILLKLRRRLIDLLTLNEFIIKKSKYKKITKIIDGDEHEVSLYVGEKVTHCRAKDWITAEKAYRGGTSRERVRLVCREVNKITKKIRKITFEIDRAESLKK